MDQPWDWSDLIFSFIILAHTNILTQFSDDSKLLDFVNAKVSWKNLGDSEDLDDPESSSNSNGIKIVVQSAKSCTYRLMMKDFSMNWKVINWEWQKEKKKSNLVNQEQKKISATVQSVRKMDVILGNSVEVSKRGMKNSTRTYSHIIYVKECSV